MFSAALDLLFPPRCVGCETRGAWLCLDCQQRIITQRVGPHCAICDRPSAVAPCAVCAHDPPQIAGVRVVGAYDPPLKDAIWALKFQRKCQVARPLGTLLARFWQAQGMPTCAGIVTVPMPADRLRQRGYNPAAEIASQCARTLGVPFWRGAIARTRPAPPQRGLDAPARRANVAGLFTCAPRAVSAIPGRRVLVIDDVTTTGATLQAVALALQAAGAAEVWGLALARPTMRLDLLP